MFNAIAHKTIKVVLANYDTVKRLYTQRLDVEDVIAAAAAVEHQEHVGNRGQDV